MPHHPTPSALPATQPTPLGLRTEGIPKLAVHRIVQGTDSEGHVIREETGWGPDPYADAPEGWSFTYTTCLTSG